jgi:hypothetical protein
MKYRFANTDQGNLVLVGDDKIIQKVDTIAGYEFVKINVADGMIDGMTDSMIAKGIMVPDDTKKAEVKVKEKESLLKFIVSTIFSLTLVTIWLMGIVLASGWMKVVAVFPFYSFYLVVEVVMKHHGMIV